MFAGARLLAPFRQRLLTAKEGEWEVAEGAPPVASPGCRRREGEGFSVLAPAQYRRLWASAPPVLNGLGLALAFSLLNIEIADYFSKPGATLTFELSGSLGQDMTYSIGWALFPGALFWGALALVVVVLLVIIARLLPRRR